MLQGNVLVAPLERNNNYSKTEEMSGKKLAIPMILGSLILMVSCNEEAAKVEIDLDNQSHEISYSLGVSIAGNLKKQKFASMVDADVLAQGIHDTYAEKELLIAEEEANKILNEYVQKMQQADQLAQQQTQMATAGVNLKVGQEFLEKNKTVKGVVTLASGLQYKIITKGSGASPGPTDNVTVHYHGTLIDGTVFDSSVDRGQPSSFPLNGVISGWTEGLQLMKVGGKWTFYIPFQLAYGERGGSRIEPNSALIFEVELLAINK
ncbi:MAG: FKBP-type peptidyl-prolyl cis-trans isomerase [Flavobacteriales bacterium]|nr:FKBP-type peptidyl-prolyl cis-trans isomerase [Flavobacteriales bacterium]